MKIKILIGLILLLLLAGAVSAFEFENLKTIENYSEFDDEGYSVHKIDKKRYILVEEVSKDDVDYKTEWFENHTGFHYKVYPERENIYYVEDEIFEEYCYQEIVEIEGDRYMVSLAKDNPLTPSEKTEFMGEIKEFNKLNNFKPVEI